MVYFITQNNKFVKVGVSGNPAARIKELQTGNPNKLVLWFCIGGGQAEEQYLHRILSCVRTRGEWFELTSGVRTILTELVFSYGCDFKRFSDAMPWVEGGRKEYDRLRAIQELTSDNFKP